MGAEISRRWNNFWPDMYDKIPHKYEVDYRNPPTFDPMLGFPKGRKEREISATREEMFEANIAPFDRDYCADKYMDMAKCFHHNSSFSKVFMGACDHHRHVFDACEYEDVVLRYKEYERERRLIERRKRRIAKGLESDPAQKTATM